MYIDRPLAEYLDDLAAKKPAPGGGSACALTAALGTSLMLMVGNFTIGKPEYADVQDKIAGIQNEVCRLDAELRILIDRDVAAYNKLSGALKKPDRDGTALAEHYKDALVPPYSVAEISGKCMRLCRDLAGCGNKNLASDIAMAAILFDSAFFSARCNVYINLRYMTDMDYIEKIHNTLRSLEEMMPRMKEEIVEMCEDIISG